MKKTPLFFVLFFFASFLFTNAQSTPTEFDLLVNYLEEKGNLSRSFLKNQIKHIEKKVRMLYS